MKPVFTIDPAQLPALLAFARVAAHGNFRRAAAELDVSPSALSQTIRGLETRLGVRLLLRTTRRVTLTEAGDILLARILPALTTIDAAVDDLRQQRERPAGVLRITVPQSIVTALLEPHLPDFFIAYPEVQLDLRVDAAHNCLRHRYASSGLVYRWEFCERDRWYEVSVQGSLTTNDVALSLRAAAAGTGLVYTIEPFVREAVECGRLVSLLEEYLPPYDGFYLYYPSRAQLAPKVRVFADFLRARLNGAAAKEP